MMNQLFDYLVDQGTPKDTIILLLMLPVIAFLIALIRQFIGIKAFGIYTPLIVTFALVETSLKYGLAIFILVITSATLARFAVRKFRILYLPRMAIVITTVSIVFLMALIEAAWNERTGFLAVSIFPILIMITLAEKFVDAQIKQGDKEAVILSIETIIISVLGYFIVISDTTQSFLYNNAYIVLLIIPLSILLGKWTGLRIPEYWRFRNIIDREK